MEHLSTAAKSLRDDLPKVTGHARGRSKSDDV